MGYTVQSGSAYSKSPVSISWPMTSFSCRPGGT